MDTRENQKVVGHIIRQSIITVMAWITPVAPVAGYLVGLCLGLSGEDILWAVTRILPPVFLTGGIILPWLGMAALVRGNFRVIPGEPQELRIQRLLKLPWKVAAMGVQMPYFFGGIFFVGPVVLLFHRSPLLLCLGVLLGVAIGVVLTIPVAIKLENVLMPYILEEQNRLGTRPAGRGFFWPRQSWYLPFVFAASLASTLALIIVVTILHGTQLREGQVEAIRANKALTQAQAEQMVALLHDFSGTLVSGLSTPLTVLGLFALLVPTFSAWMLARRQARAAAAVQEAIEALASGAPRAPQWASTDEVGDLSAGMVAVLERLQEIPVTLQATASRLSQAGTSLGSASAQQRQSLMQQAAALQEAQVTSQEIRQTSDLAADRAATVLNVASRAEQLGQSGETAIEKSLTGLNAIRTFVSGVRGRVVRLQESASQIGDIATTVKDLADQSNILAINAAIEAARSGEHGKGFAVVAQEFRTLADQSVRETVRISRMLTQVSSAIEEVVAMTEQGAREVEGGLEMVKSSGDSLRELSVIIRENAAAARQIATAVGQQNSGVTQIFTAISQLSTGMDETVQRLDTTLEATRTLESATQEVSAVARRYSVN